MNILKDDFVSAQNRLRPIIHHTPLWLSKSFSDIAGNQIYLKAENLQKTGSFKIRGAYNKICQFKKDEADKGVITASAGNHAQGVAYAATLLGIKSTIVMPETTPLAKVVATKAYGAEIIKYGSCYDDAYSKAVEIKAKTGQNFIHAFNDIDIIIGQGTIGLEVLQDNPEIDAIVVPIGGGGLISGIALAVKSITPDISVIGVELDGFEAMKKSIAQGHIVSSGSTCLIADGIAVKKPGDITYSIIRDIADDILVVTEQEILEALFMLIQRAKLIVEGAGAAALAAVISGKLTIRHKKVAVVLSGGNIDVSLISNIINKCDINPHPF